MSEFCVTQLKSGECPDTGQLTDIPEACQSISTPSSKEPAAEYDTTMTLEISEDERIFIRKLILIRANSREREGEVMSDI